MLGSRFAQPLSTKKRLRSTVILTGRMLWILVDGPPQPIYGPFSGTTRVSRCQKRTSGLYGAREDLVDGRS